MRKAGLRPAFLAWSQASPFLSGSCSGVPSTPEPGHPWQSQPDLGKGVGEGIGTEQRLGRWDSRKGWLSSLSRRANCTVLVAPMPGTPSVQSRKSRVPSSLAKDSHWAPVLLVISLMVCSSCPRPARRTAPRRRLRCPEVFSLVMLLSAWVTLTLLRPTLSGPILTVIAEAVAGPSRRVVNGEPGQKQVCLPDWWSSYLQKAVRSHTSTPCGNRFSLELNKMGAPKRQPWLPARGRQKSRKPASGSTGPASEKRPCPRGRPAAPGRGGDGKISGQGQSREGPAAPQAERAKGPGRARRKGGAAGAPGDTPPGSAPG